MDLTIEYKHLVHEGHFQVDTKDVTFIVECELEQHEAEYMDDLIMFGSYESDTPIGISEAWLNDADSTELELTTNLINKLLCLIN